MSAADGAAALAEHIRIVETLRARLATLESEERAWSQANKERLCTYFLDLTGRDALATFTSVEARKERIDGYIADYRGFLLESRPLRVRGDALRKAIAQAEIDLRNVVRNVQGEPPIIEP